MMIQKILTKAYWSRSRNFLLPLTGIKKTKDFDVRSYVKWKEHSIDNYELTVKIEYGPRYEEFKQFIERLTQNEYCLLREVYNYENFSVLIFDLSSWADDIRQFVKGKFSRFSPAAKNMIKDYHTFYDGNGPEINITILSCISPRDPVDTLENLSPLDYMIKYYILGDNPTHTDRETAEAWKKVGEVCSACIEEKETLVLDEGQDDIELHLE